MDRKNFLRTSTALAAGGLVLPSWFHLAPQKLSDSDAILINLEDREEFWNLLGRFAFAVGARVVSSLITDYVRDWIKDDDVETGIHATNRTMRQDGFNDFSGSEVSKTNQGEFMYPVFRNGSSPNICAPIFNPRRYSTRPITMVEGPALAGLVTVAEQRFNSKSRAAEYLMPTKEITTGTGSFETGYSRPTVYVSRRGTVKVDYASDGRGNGLARTTITDFNNNLLVDDYANVSYRA